MRNGSFLTLSTRQGVYKYRVYAHRIVDPSNMASVRDKGYEQLVLTSCHPLYSAAQRYVLYAKRV